MRKAVCGLLLIVICLSAVSCGGSEVEIPSGMKLASEGSALYYLFVPNSWSVKESDPPTAFISASDMSNVMVIAYSLPAPSDSTASGTDEIQDSSATEAVTETAVNPRAPYIDRFWDEFVKDANTSLINFSQVGEAADTQQLGGLYAKQYVYTHKTGGVEYKHRMAVTYYGELIIYVVYSSTAENYDSHAGDVDAIIREFKFRK